MFLETSIPEVVVSVLAQYKREAGKLVRAKMGCGVDVIVNGGLGYPGASPGDPEITVEAHCQRGNMRDAAEFQANVTRALALAEALQAVFLLAQEEALAKDAVDEQAAAEHEWHDTPHPGCLACTRTRL